MSGADDEQSGCRQQRLDEDLNRAAADARIAALKVGQAIGSCARLAIGDRLLGELNRAALHLAAANGAIQDRPVCVHQHLGAGAPWHTAARPNDRDQRAWLTTLNAL
jgi:hypothetical protein